MLKDNVLGKAYGYPFGKQGLSCRLMRCSTQRFWSSLRADVVSGFIYCCLGGNLDDGSDGTLVCGDDHAQSSQKKKMAGSKRSEEGRGDPAIDSAYRYRRHMRSRRLTVTDGIKKIKTFEAVLVHAPKKMFYLYAPRAAVISGWIPLSNLPAVRTGAPPLVGLVCVLVKIRAVGCG